MSVEYRAVFRYPPSRLGLPSDSYSAPVDDWSKLPTHEPRSDETHGWRSGVQVRHVGQWRTLDVEQPYSPPARSPDLQVDIGPVLDSMCQAWASMAGFPGQLTDASREVQDELGRQALGMLLPAMPALIESVQAALQAAGWRAP